MSLEKTPARYPNALTPGPSLANHSPITPAHSPITPSSAIDAQGPPLTSETARTRT